MLSTAFLAGLKLTIALIATVVAEDVPEASIGVAPAWRGQGIGTALLDELIVRARAHGLRGISLSVEDGNRARVLYERAGFRVVGREGNSDVMLLTL
jgi:ribosomal protein S18 acetylase RimI-like enzyme